MTHRIILGAAAASIVVVTAVASVALAWHPEGVITKQVQNVTKESALVDADTAESAVAAEPGDTLRYVITVSNEGEPSENGYNDMAQTNLSDTLPSGVALSTSADTRTITDSLGTIKPGASVTKEYTVTVTASEETTIKNTACFTGDSTVNDNPQQGCDDAYVTVTVPETPVTPTTPELPATTTPAPVTPLPAELPKTGAAETIFGSALAIGALWYGVHRFIASRRELFKSL